MAFAIWSPDFDDKGWIPQRFTADGANVSPALIWHDPPQPVKSFALIFDDPDAPMGTWTHWVAYDIPGSKDRLAEAVPAKDTIPGEMKQGLNTWNRIGYSGPSPPPGKHHRYFFKLYALDVTLDVPARPDKSALLKAMEGHILGQAEFHGVYGRKG